MNLVRAVPSSGFEQHFCYNHGMFDSREKNQPSSKNVQPLRPVEDYHVARDLARGIASATGTGPRSKGIRGSVENNIDSGLRHMTAGYSFTRAKELLSSSWRTEFLELVKNYYNET